jgi:Domain of Unknown Function (DUF1206)
MTVTYRLPTIRMPTARTAERDLVKTAARLGLTARAFIYLLIGALSVLVAVGHSTAETDQWGAMQQLNRDTLGHILLWMVALGLAGYAFWRFSEAVFGPVGDRKKAGPRLKSFGRGCIYTFFSVMAFQIAVGHVSQSQAGRQENLSAAVMRHTGGRLAVGVVGAVVVVIGLTLMREGITRKFEKYLDLSSTSLRMRRVVEILGVTGTVARGAVFALAGAFAIEAAWDYQPQKAAGLDGALRSLRDTAAGPWLLGVFALGLVAFGLYGFAEARWRRA